MTNEGPIENRDRCLGVNIERNKKDKSLSICQTKYVTKIYKRFNMHDYKPTWSIPLEIRDK